MTESSNTPATEGDLPNGGLPSYNFETASEAERWCYDQGFEAGWNARLSLADLTTTDDIRIVLKAIIPALDAMIAEQS